MKDEIRKNGIYNVPPAICDRIESFISDCAVEYTSVEIFKALMIYGIGIASEYCNTEEDYKIIVRGYVEGLFKLNDGEELK